VALTRDELEEVKALIAAMLGQQPPPPIADDALAIDASYDPSDGTITAKYGDTDAMFPDTGDVPAMPTRVELATTQIGDQYGPRGNERVVLLPTRGGPVALLLHGPDDSPGAPSGERWIEHRNAAGVVDSYIKHTNDGPTHGDGLGAHLSNGGALHRASTSGGRSITQDDAAKKITISGAGATPHTRVLDDNALTKGIIDTTAGGLKTQLDDVLQRILHQASSSVYTIVDAAGNAISHVAPAVGIGDLFSNLSAPNAAARKSDLDALATSIKQMVGNALQQAAQSAIVAAIPNASTWLATIQSGLPTLSFTDLTSSIANLIAPDGSSVVLVK
jgi:hypothetical protein